MTDLSETARFVRKGISKRLRFEVFKRDGFRCGYCGATPQQVLLECDHIEPVSKGGPTEIDNLVTACFDCNRGKSDISLNDIPQSMADRAAETIERESQIAGYQDVLKQKRLRVESNGQEVLELFCQRFGKDSIPRGDFTSIKRFVDRLGLDSVHDAADIATGKWHSYGKAFRYFCGICWNRIRELEGNAP